MLPACSHFVDKYGGVSKINQEFLNQLTSVQKDFANGVLRTLLLCYKETKTVSEEWNEVENNLVVLALVGIRNPLRDGIAEAVRQYNEGGVRVRMVTGDNKITAIAIAKEASILPVDWEPLDADWSVMEGKEFR
jgi:P-type Ca2+ transporter type 2C